MARLDKTIGNLFNGVSQQPAILRLDSQCEVEENCLVTLTDGCIKRPPTEFVALLDSVAGTNAFIHTINRDLAERYILVITTDTEEPIEIFTVDGVKCNVSYVSSAKTYCTASDPKTTFKATTVLDHTILVNTSVTCAMSGTPTTAQTPTGIVFVKQAIDRTTYQVFVDGTKRAEYKTDFTATDPVATVFDTMDIAEELYNNLVSSIGGTFNLTLVGSSIILTRKNSAAFTLKTLDGRGDLAIFGFYGEAQKFLDLPPKATNNFVMAITGMDSNAFTRYYVKFNEGLNTWEETVKPGIDNSFNATTMPHKIVRTAIVGGIPQFEVSAINWSTRTVGDTNSCPEPSFIGETIRDTFYFKDRLGFLSGENVILSKLGDYFNFWYDSAVQGLDTDLIDVSTSTNIVSTLINAIPYGKNCLLFSEQQQFNLGSGALVFAPKNTSIDPVTSFEYNTSCKPVAVGPNIYFTVKNGTYSAVREYYTSPDSLLNDASDITIQCPRYIPSDVFCIAASSAKDMLFLLASSEPNTLYVYKFYYANGEKKQSAWNKWIFADEILNAAVIGNYLYLVQRKSDEAATPAYQVFITKINLENVATDSLPFRVNLDKQCLLTGVYNSETNKTVWTLPYNDPDDTFEVVEPEEGNIILNTSKTSINTIEVRGNHSSAPYYVGKNYTSRHQLSELYIPESNGSVSLQGTLSISGISVYYYLTGYFKIKYTGYTGYNSEVTGEKVFGPKIGEAVLGKPNIKTGKMDVTFNSDARTCTIELINDTYLPSNFTAVSIVCNQTKETTTV